MIRNFAITFGAAMLAAGAAAADPIEGRWKTEAGSTAQISSCGKEFCVKLINGSHAGKQIGKMAVDGNEYRGTITDPNEDKTYDGKAWLPSNSTLKMRGYSGLFFKTQTWTRQ